MEEIDYVVITAGSFDVLRRSSAKTTITCSRSSVGCATCRA